ncbi:MAG: Coenzyme F420 hydrogenase/dehydrogenase, beta subunit C-terminal domain [Bacteroidetes bacterium]|nr:Coenzyme F420 hydrogenase/dehydrogenase, beta subunit C-terminal domain [Bacteroidota bacterium]
MTNTYEKLIKEVVESGLCTHCGTCVGLANGQLKMKETKNGPIPISTINNPVLNNLVYDACPGKGINYPVLIDNIFPSKVNDWRIGFYNNIFIGFSLNSLLRRNGASGGVITSLLIYLLNKGFIDGAVTLKQGSPKPWLAEPIIATTEEEIIQCAQSVYAPIPVNIIIEDIKHFHGNLAFIGLPDQVSSIRFLQSKNVIWTKKIKYFFGPYVGTNLYSEAIENFIKSNGYKKLEEIKRMKYRDGEWPGYLSITMNDGQILKSEKFYYNYLIPFFITKASLLSVDFTNELTDISVGDAWHPKYESKGEGYSVIVARSKKGLDLLMGMKDQKQISLTKIKLQEATDMHSHMIDFKKRGAFIRFRFRKLFGLKVPEFGYIPEKISSQRLIVELFISIIFFIGGTKLVRYLVVFIPIKFIGPFFNFIRIKWKSISKSTKRKNLDSYKVILKQPEYFG